MSEAASPGPLPGDPPDVMWSWHYADRGGPGPEVFWHPHPVVKRTGRHLIVADDPVLHRRPGQTRPAHYLLDRAKIEADGRVYSPTASHTFFTTACKEAEQRKAREDVRSTRMAAVMEELETGMKVLELGRKLDFAPVAPGLLKAAGFEVYVADGRTEPCRSCGGAGHSARGECGVCKGAGACSAAANFRALRGMTSYSTIPGKSLEHARELIARGTFSPGTPAFVMLRRT